MDLDALAQLPLTYSEVGATAAAQLPPGYDHLSVSAQIGTGDQRFEQAAESVLHWGMQHGAGLGVQASSEVVVVSAIVVVKMLGVLRAPCRVVYVIDEPDVRGFAYGTCRAIRSAARNGSRSAGTRIPLRCSRRCRRSPGPGLG